MNKSSHQNTRSLLLEEAEKLIRTRGYAGFSYANLSALVGITKASIHHHFPTKDQLVQATLETYRLRYLEQMQTIKDQNLDALAAILAYGTLYLDGLGKGLGCLCAVLATEKDLLPISIQQATDAFFNEHLDWLTALCAKGQGDGSLSNKLSPDAAAHLILASLEGALLMARLKNDNFSFERTIQTISNSLKT